MLTNNKAWGTNLGQRGSKSWFWDENKMGSREEMQKLGAPVSCNSLGELELAMESYLVQHPWFWVFQVEDQSILS